jgi:hypothetical protein
VIPPQNAGPAPPLLMTNHSLGCPTLFASGHIPFLLPCHFASPWQLVPSGFGDSRLISTRLLLQVTAVVSLWKLSKCVVTCPESTAPQHFIASQRVTCTDEEGAEELLDCARAGEPEGISEMLQRPGVHVDYQNETGTSALHYAAANGHEDCVSLLLQKGARMMPNSSGNTPLHWAVLNKSAACVKALLTAPGTDVLAKNGFGRSALTEAFAAEQTDVTLSASPSLPLCHPFIFFHKLLWLVPLLPVGARAVSPCAW